MFNFNRIKGDHLFRDIDEDIRDQVIKSIIEASTPRKSFFIMVAVASFICTAGLLMNSVALIIGAMLIAPMLSALLSISLGVVTRNFKLFYRSVLVVFKAILLLFIAAFGISMFFKTSQDFSYEFLLKTNFQLEIFVVALIVGFAASLSFVRKELSQYVTGTAIAVTLIPPVSVSAIALRMGYTEQFVSAIWIFFINLIGIIISSMLVFIVTKFHHSKRMVRKELAREEKFLDKMTRREKIKKWIREGLTLIKIFSKK